MTDEIVDFDKTRHAIEMAKAVDEVISIRDRMAAMVAFYKSERDPEQARKANELKLWAERRIGQMSMTLKKEGGPGRGNKKKSRDATSLPGKQETLKTVGISKQEASVFERLAKIPDEEFARSAREGKSARGIFKRPSKPMTPRELEEAGFSPKTERYRTEGGGTASRIKLLSDQLRAARERIVELEAENARLINDLDALQTGNLMRMSAAAMAQRATIAKKIKIKRDERQATEAAPDEKTKEAFEREIVRLKSQLKSERSKVQAFMANGRTVLDNKDRKTILVCLHPDGVVDPIEKAKRERAFMLFSNAVPEVGF